MRSMPTYKRSPELIDTIINGIESGTPLRQLCRDNDLSFRAFYNWVDDDEALAARFARARLDGFDAIAEETLEIADDGTNDYVEKTRPDGSKYDAFDAEHVQRSKLRVDTRLKLLAKWDPKRYGERTTTELTGANGGPVDITDTAAAAKIAALLEAAKARKG